MIAGLNHDSLCKDDIFNLKLPYFDRLMSSLRDADTQTEKDEDEPPKEPLPSGDEKSRVAPDVREQSFGAKEAPASQDISGSRDDEDPDDDPSSTCSFLSARSERQTTQDVSGNSPEKTDASVSLEKKCDEEGVEVKGDFQSGSGDGRVCAGDSVPCEKKITSVITSAPPCETNSDQEPVLLSAAHDLEQKSEDVSSVADAPEPLIYFSDSESSGKADADSSNGLDLFEIVDKERHSADLVNDVKMDVDYQGGYPAKNPDQANLDNPSSSVDTSLSNQLVAIFSSTGDQSNSRLDSNPESFASETPSQTTTYPGFQYTANPKPRDPFGPTPAPRSFKPPALLSPNSASFHVSSTLDSDFAG